jgi:ABC-type branched-subunit amino acid transport system substrate-binding protein
MVSEMVQSTRRRAVAAATLAAFVGAAGIGVVSSSATAASKKPVEVFVMAADKNQIFNAPQVWAGAKAAAQRLNKRGGIRGAKIKIVTCNSMSDHNVVTACARKAISDKAVAVVAPAESFTADAVPLLRKAKILIMGSGGDPIEQTSSNSFPLGGGAYGIGGFGIYFNKNLKIKDVAIGVVQTDTGAALAKKVESVIKSSGLNYKGTVSFPVTTQDYAPVAQQLQSTGAKGVILISGGILTANIIQAANQINFRPAWFTSAAGSPPSDAAKYSVLQGVYVGGSFPPANANLPAMRQFRKDAAAAKRAGVSNTDDQDDSMVQAWLAVGALTTVGKTIKGTITSAKMLRAMSKAKNVNLEGLGRWSPGGKGLADAPRVKNILLYISKIDGGVYKLATPKGINVFKEAKLK